MAGIKEQTIFCREVVIPAAVKAALARSMTEAEQKFVEDLKRIYDGDEEHARDATNAG
jgi:hypothetical protein